jgi:hypothetical protein
MDERELKRQMIAAFRECLPSTVAMADKLGLDLEEEIRVARSIAGTRKPLTADSRRARDGDPRA